MSRSSIVADEESFYIRSSARRCGQFFPELRSVGQRRFCPSPPLLRGVRYTLVSSPSDTRSCVTCVQQDRLVSI